MRNNESGDATAHVPVLPALPRTRGMYMPRVLTSQPATGRLATGATGAAAAVRRRHVGGLREESAVQAPNGGLDS